MAPRTLSRSLALVVSGLIACSTEAPTRTDPPAGSALAASSVSSPAPAATQPGASAGVRLIDAPAGVEVATYVRDLVAKTKSEGRDLIVYVGATWCEPCVRFHEAAARGELDADLPKLSLLVFDHDRDGDALAAAGYRSHMIPLFVLPLPDGRSSQRQVEGSVKGERAVATIVPRLRGLIAAGGQP